MSRLPTALATFTDAAQVRFVLLVKLALKTRTLYLCTGTQDVTWDGATWVGNGDFAGIPAIEEGSDVSPYQVDLSLSGLNAQLVRDALAIEAFHLQDVTLYGGVLDDNAPQLGEDPVVLWGGVMDIAFLETTGDTLAITLRCESYLARFQRTNGLRFTDEDQQRLYANDRFFEYLPQMQDLTLKWGT